MGDPLVFPALFFLYLLFLTVKGQAVKLTRTEYAILKLLMENPKQVIAKSVLLDRISLDTPDCLDVNGISRIIFYFFTNMTNVACDNIVITDT